MGIVVIGAVFVDIKGYPLGEFVPKGRNSGRLEEVHGGVSRNIAEDIANAGFSVTYLSLVDDNGTGHDVVKRLQISGVITDYMRYIDGGMGSWLAVYDDHGDVYASISKRPDLRPIADILDKSGDEIFREADSILLELDCEEEILQKTFNYAKKYSIPVFAVISNVNIARERMKYLRLSQCLVCNQQEIGYLLQEDNMESMDKMELVEQLESHIIKDNLPSIVVTLGKEGAVYSDGKELSGGCSASDVSVVDTTGAGDAFFAGASLGLTYGKSLDEACDIGTYMASRVIATEENVCPKNCLAKMPWFDMD